MVIISPHINFNGNALEAFTFYKSVFGGEFSKIIRFKDIESAEFPVPAHEKDKLMNISLAIGGSNLIGNDVPSAMGRVNENENRSKISVSSASLDEARKLFASLSAGGQVEIMSDENSFYAMFRDKYGIEWIIEFESK